MTFSKCSLALFAAGLASVSADLPVHCLRHEVVGEWRFTLGALSEKRSSCGHDRPDTEETQPERAVIDEMVDILGDKLYIVSGSAGKIRNTDHQSWHPFQTSASNRLSLLIKKKQGDPPAPALTPRPRLGRRNMFKTVGGSSGQRQGPANDETGEKVEKKGWKAGWSSIRSSITRGFTGRESVHTDDDLALELVAEPPALRAGSARRTRRLSRTSRSAPPGDPTPRGAREPGAQPWPLTEGGSRRS